MLIYLRLFVVIFYGKVDILKYMLTFATLQNTILSFELAVDTSLYFLSRGSNWANNPTRFQNSFPETQPAGRTRGGVGILWDKSVMESHFSFIIVKV